MKIRIFTSEDILKNMILSGTHYHYLVNVLRVKNDSEVFLFNNNGEYIFCVNLITKKNITLTKIKKTDNNEMPSGIISCIPLIKPDTMSRMIRQSVEMGAEKIILFNSRYSSVRHINIDKMKIIIIEALEQCGRILLPSIIYYDSLNELIKNADFKILYANEKLANNTELSVLNSNKIEKNIGTIVGPEGGFSEEELELLKTCEAISLGQHILRSDTALVNMLLIAKMFKNRLKT